MKKTVLCVFTSIFYLLVVCSIFSQKIEIEMLTQVEIIARKSIGSTLKFPLTMLFLDEDGEHFYEVAEGSGWDSGLRSQELSSWRADYVQSQIYFNGNVQTYNFIKSASRQPQNGDRVEVIEEYETADDQYLAFFSYGVPQECSLPSNAEVAAQNENALLLNMTDAQFPFFQHNAKISSITTDLADCIFSVTEVEAFLEELPAVVTVFALLMLGVILCFCSCCLSIRALDNQKILWLNVVIVVASLFFMWHMLQGIDLPASMLPSSNIFDFAHYKEEFTLIFDSLRRLGITDHSIFQTTTQVKEQCLQILRSFTLAAVGIPVLELLLTFTRHIALNTKSQFTSNQ